MSREEREKVLPPAGVIVWFQTIGWMDTGLMVKYVDYLNDIRMKNGTQGNSAMLAYDSFRGHLEKSVKEKLALISR